MTIEHGLIMAIRDTLDDLVTILPYMDEKTVSDSIDWLGRALDKAGAVRDTPEEERGQYERGLCKYPFSSCKMCGGKDVDVMDWICNKEYCITRCTACGNFSIMPSIPFKPKDMSIETALELTAGIISKKAESENRSKSSEAPDAELDDKCIGRDGGVYRLRDD